MLFNKTTNYFLVDFKRHFRNFSQNNGPHAIRLIAAIADAQLMQIILISAQIKKTSAITIYNFTNKTYNFIMNAIIYI